MKLEKTVTIGLVALLVTSVLAVAFVNASDLADVRSESEQPVLSEGNGTPDDPYMIYDVYDLQEMKDELTAHYTLANDIDASNTNGWNDGAGFDPVGDWENRFTGSLDGNDYAITGLYIDRPNSWYIGLFGFVGLGGEVRNVDVIDAYVSGRYYIAGLAGYNSGNVDNSYARGDVNGDRVGGLVGGNEGTVSNCYAAGNVSGFIDVGGLVGENSGTVSNSYATGTVNSTGVYVGGLVGENSGTVSNSFATSNVSGFVYVGGLVGGNEGTVSNSFYNIDSVLINDGHHITIGGIFDAQYQDWYSSDLYLDIADYSETLVPSGNYYEIRDIDGLRDILGFAGKEGYKFRVAGDINLSTVPGLYIPYLNVEFDGDNYTLSDLFIDMPFAVKIGMFGHVGSDGEVRNIGVADANVSGYTHVGLLVGGNWEGTVSNSYSTGTVSGDRRVGGLLGENSGTVSNSYSTGTVSGDRRVGGLLGENSGTVSNSYSTGTVSGDRRVGGLVGENSGTVSNSFYELETTGQFDTGKGEPKTTEEMMDIRTFTDDANWDIIGVADPDDRNTDYVWNIVDGETYPFLSGIIPPDEDDNGDDDAPGMGLMMCIVAISIALVSFKLKKGGADTEPAEDSLERYEIDENT